jgi:hypothetical protein
MIGRFSFGLPTFNRGPQRVGELVDGPLRHVAMMVVAADSAVNANPAVG